jgi:hypothetical protein
MGFEHQMELQGAGLPAQSKALESLHLVNAHEPGVRQYDGSGELE